MRYLTLMIATWLAAVLGAAAAQTTPGETSGHPLAPLLVTGYDKVTGELSLSYQSGCGVTGNTIYYGSLDQVSSLAWSGDVCGVGTGGSNVAFHPGSGSYFFVIVGNDDVKEGSYGQTRLGATLIERAPRTGNTCGLTQSLAAACQPASVGDACSSNLDCGTRRDCVANLTGGAQCACLPPFAGTFCETCAPGYAGPDCRECAPGFVSNKMENSDGGDRANDTTAPELFRCEPDVPGTCAGRSCGGHGTCVVAGRNAVCACQPGFTGADCQDCAPNYQRDAAGACTLGTVCREAKCGGHGNCLPATFGDFICQCDAGYPGADCGGAPLRIVTSAESLSLYSGESVVLTPQGGPGPFTFRLVDGPGLLQSCDPRGGDPLCPIGSVRVTATHQTDPLTDGLLVIRVSLENGAGPQTAINLAALPSTFLPMTGTIKAELVPFYEAIQKFMRARGVRGAVLGISKGGTVIATNGYGYRDAGLDNDPFVNAGEGGPLVQPSSPFRIASVTKPLTAAAVRQAAADAGVGIGSNSSYNRAANWIQDSLGFNMIDGAPSFNYNVPTPGTTDPSWANVTIQHLINHHAGFWRDTVLAPVGNIPAYNAGLLPFTLDVNNTWQPALSGTATDMVFATSYLLAGMQLTSDPRPTAGKTIVFAAGNKFHYPPGGFTPNNKDNYSNLGYMIAGRVLEGLKHENYDPDDPSSPNGWGKFPELLQNYLCESSGIQTGIWPGDAFNPQPGEPYYRDLDFSGNEVQAWNVAQGASRIRYNNQKWEFCQGNCPNGPGAVWGTSANAPFAYGGFWLAQLNSAGGMVATTSALLRFARNHRVKVGAPGDGADGNGSLLDAPGNYVAQSSHNGSLPGTSSLLWQMSGQRTNRVPMPVGAWISDPSAPPSLDFNGNVRINEQTVSKACTLPSDVAVAVMFNQRQDRKAPALLNNPNAQPTGNSTQSAVYNRIFDFLGDAACKVDDDGWPQVAEPPAQVLFQPVCN